jgi:hypothetical protein
MALDGLVGIGVFVACDCLIKLNRFMNKQQSKQTTLLGETGSVNLHTRRMGRYRYMQQPEKNVRRESLSVANKLEYCIIKQNMRTKNVFSSR